jgi:hypothetical protein
MSFYVYGPKIITTRELFKDPALESRCLSSFARGTNGEFPMYRIEIFAAEALKIRNKLLMWRFRNYIKVRDRLKALESPTLKREFFGEENVELRTAELVIPLLLIFEGERMRELLKSTALQMTEFLKSIDPDSHFEEEVPKAVKDLTSECVKGEGEREKPIVEIMGDFYRVPLVEIAKRVIGKDEESVEKEELATASKAIAKFLRKQLFKVRPESQGRSFAYIPMWWITPHILPNYPNLPNHLGDRESGLSEASEASEATYRGSTREIVQNLHAHIRQGPMEKFVAEIVKFGLPEPQAQALFERLIKDSILVGNRYGDYGWSQNIRLAGQGQTPADWALTKPHKESTPPLLDFPDTEYGRALSEVAKITLSDNTGQGSEVCEHCEHFRESSCAKEHPDLIRPEALYPSTCKAFERRKEKRTI